MNLFDGLQGKGLPEYLHWINEPEQWSFGAQGLEVTAPASADYFNDPESEQKTASAPFLYTTAQGDFDLTARVGVEMKSIFDSACIMVWVDGDNWAKLCYEYWSSTPCIVSVVTKTKSDDCPSLRIGAAKPYLKMLRSGNCFGFFYSLDAVDWTLIRYFHLDAPPEVKVGVVAQCPAGEWCPVVFEELRLEQREIRTAKRV